VVGVNGGGVTRMISGGSVGAWDGLVLLATLGSGVTSSVVDGVTVVDWGKLLGGTGGGVT